jgi:hypothetical protein
MYTVHITLLSLSNKLPKKSRIKLKFFPCSTNIFKLYDVVRKNKSIEIGDETVITADKWVKLINPVYVGTFILSPVATK